MRVEFQPSFEDLLEASRFHAGRAFHRYRPLFYGAGLLLVVFLFGSQVLYYQGFLNLVLVLFALWFLSYSLVMRRARRRGVRKAWEGSPHLRHPIRYEFGAEGISSKSKNRSGQIAWSEVQSFLETPRLFLVYLTRQHYLVIPKRALEAPGQLDSFRDLLRSKAVRPGR